MVYPFDIKDGRELKNKDVTENGFYLDLARSRYLKLYIKKEVLEPGTDGLIEDTRFNGSAKEGKEYTDEGIYTIEAHNKYTDKWTTKKIYVGKPASMSDLKKRTTIFRADGVDMRDDKEVTDFYIRIHKLRTLGGYRPFDVKGE